VYDCETIMLQEWLQGYDGSSKSSCPVVSISSVKGQGLALLRTLLFLPVVMPSTLSSAPPLVFDVMIHRHTVARL